MGIPVIIYGQSGVGKTRSLKSFKEDEIYLVKVIKKPLPFKGQFKFVSNTDNVQTIMAGLSKMSTKVAVIDDATFLMVNKFMKEHGSGDQFKMYNEIANMMKSLFDFITSPAVADDVIVYLIMHEEVTESSFSKLRLIGKLLEQKSPLEAMTTVTLRATVKGGRHIFQTQSDGSSIAKSPEGMFAGDEIDNDLKAVDTAIRAYWGIKAGKDGK